MFRGQSVNVSGIEEALARVLLEHFGELVDDRARETAASASRPNHLERAPCQPVPTPQAPGAPGPRHQTRPASGLCHGGCPVAPL